MRKIDIELQLNSYGVAINMINNCKLSQYLPIIESYIEQYGKLFGSNSHSYATLRHKFHRLNSDIADVS